DVGKKTIRSRQFGVTRTDQSLERIESKIRQVLGTKVTVRANSDGRGQITIVYYSADDLDRLLDLFAIIEKYH
ncbi:MAG: hypothetical protein ACE5H0_01185, partial [Bacteroidota bacterium]